MAGSTGLDSPRRRLLGLRILIAEDSWVTADTLSVLMEEQGARVVGPSATNDEALELVSAGDIDVAVVDMALGDTFADALTDGLSERRIPYIILTGYRALPSNADANAVTVLRKPVDLGRLVDVLSGIAAGGA